MTSQPTFYHRCKVLAQQPGVLPKIRLDRAFYVPNVMLLDSNLSLFFYRSVKANQMLQLCSAKGFLRRDRGKPVRAL